MSITNIESVSTSSSANPVVVNVTNSSVGNLLVLMFDDEMDTNSIASITDNGSPSNTWIQVPNAAALSTASATFTDIWYAVCTEVTNQITIHFTLAHSGICQYMEWSGCATSSPVDVANHISNKTTTTLGPVLSINNGNDLLLACIAVGSSNPTGVSSPWSVVANGFNGNFVQYVSPGTAMNYHAVFTASNQDNCSSGVAFLPAGTQSPALVASMFLMF